MQTSRDTSREILEPHKKRVQARTVSWYALLFDIAWSTIVNVSLPIQLAMLANVTIVLPVCCLFFWPVESATLMVATERTTGIKWVPRQASSSEQKWMMCQAARKKSIENALWCAVRTDALPFATSKGLLAVSLLPNVVTHRRSHYGSALCDCIFLFCFSRLPTQSFSRLLSDPCP